MDLYWFGQNAPTSNSLLLMLPALVCSRGYKQVREGANSKSLVEKSNGVDAKMFRCYLLSSLGSMPFRGHPSSPFLDEGKDTGYKRER